MAWVPPGDDTTICHDGMARNNDLIDGDENGAINDNRGLDPSGSKLAAHLVAGEGGSRLSDKDFKAQRVCLGGCPPQVS